MPAWAEGLKEGGVSGIELSMGGLVSLGGAIVGFIVWLVRLEGKIQQSQHQIDGNEKNIDKLDQRTTNIEVAVLSRLSAIERSLAKIEGRLSIEDTNERGR